MTPENITSGFRAAGIYPYDPNIHKPTDFMPSAVTDRPDPNIVSSEAPATDSPQVRDPNTVSSSEASATGEAQVDNRGIRAEVGLG